MNLTMFYLLIIMELGIIVFLVGRIMGVEVLMLAGIVVIAIGIMIPKRSKECLLAVLRGIN